MTVSSDSTAECAAVRLWDLAASRPGEPPPALKPLEGIRIGSPKLPLATPMTAFAVYCTAWPSVTVAAGLADGSVLLLRGDAGPLTLSVHSCQNAGIMYAV